METKDKAYGWLPEDHLLTPLKLATDAVLLRDTPIRSKMQMDAISQNQIKKGTKVSILKVSGSWVQVRTAGKKESATSWIPSENLNAVIPENPPRAYTIKNARLYTLPGPHARTVGSIEVGKFIEVLSETKGWVKIPHQGGAAYIKKEDLCTLKDLGQKGVRPLFELAPLRSAPLPYADLVRSLPVSTQLTIIDEKVQRWGEAKIPRLGNVWWPLSNEFSSEKEIPSAAVYQNKIPTHLLFQRKIFDMASSPAIPSLKFVSAEGVFRTTDGNEWAQIPNFNNENYPIAIASGGPIFVGPFVSDDHGETFQQWIRWDTLVATLKNEFQVATSGLQILEIHPQDSTGQRVLLKLNIGIGSVAQVVTDDQGLSWRAL